jgi:hypothetical protein
VPSEFVQALRDLGLADGAPLHGQPLTGGVSSDIWRIDLPQGPVCAKRALSKLRVEADWRAPIERNLYEARWMQVAEAAVPGCTPRLLGQHPGLGVLVMGYLTPHDHPLWKQQLHEGRAEPATAQAVGGMLARIHSHAAARPELAAQFPTDAIFFDIRLEPYLLATAERHADLAPVLRALVAQTQSNKRSLVHGDVSPKNILVGPPAGAGPSQAGRSPAGGRERSEPGGEPAGAGPSQAGRFPAGGRERSEPGGESRPVLLDAECAWWGDPAFDLAFCLNHLLLKCLWTPPATQGFLHCFDVLASTYLQGVDWEPPDALEQRAAALLPGLLLARVDGKSPVEYLRTEAQREPVRRCARALLLVQRSVGGFAASSARLAGVRAAWHHELRR